MARRSGYVGLVWELGGCVATFYDKDDVLRAKKDAHGDQPSEEAFEVHAPFGTIMRPLDAERDSSGQPRADRMCTMLHATDGTDQHAWMCDDPRIIAKMPLAKHGERIEHGYGSCFRRWHADGKITDWTSTTNEPDGQGIFWQNGPQGLYYRAPWGSLTFDATGFHVRDRSGARIDIGACAAPAPLDALASYATISAGMVSVEGSAVSQGTDGGAANEAAVIALAAYLVVIQGALAAVGQTIPPPPPFILNLGKVV